MERLFERAERESGLSVRERIKVGVSGLGTQAGTTFVATALAWHAANKTERNVAYIEMDGTLVTDSGTRFFDSAGMDKRFLGREFTDFFELVAKGQKIRDKKNLDEKVNWALRVPPDWKEHQTVKTMKANELQAYETEELEAHRALLAAERAQQALNTSKLNEQQAKHARMPSQMRECNSVKPADLGEPQAAYMAGHAALNAMRLVNNISGDLIVCDFGSGMPVSALYEDMDVNICVIDPKPSKLIASAETVRRMRRISLGGHRVIFVVNKDNAGVNRRELGRFLRQNAGTEVRIPLLDERLFYSAEYNCEIPAAQREIRRSTEEIFNTLLETILF